MSSNSNACPQSCLYPLISKQELSFPWLENPRFGNQNNGSCEINLSCEKFTGCGDFLRAITKTSYDFRQITNESERVYVHPLTKLSTSSLSSRSLEMCTETLGSETGSTINSSLDEYSYLLLNRESSNRIKPQKTQQFCKKIEYGCSFPPPLTSISGGSCVKVEAYRGGGRLVITAFAFSADRIHFKAERENGRLRLFSLKDYHRHSEHELAEKHEKDVGKFGCKREGEQLSSSRCSGDGSGNKKLPSLPVCVASS